MGRFYVVTKFILLTIGYIFFLLEALTSCPDSSSNLRMYFTVNLDFVNHFDKWTSF